MGEFVEAWRHAASAAVGSEGPIRSPIPKHDVTAVGSKVGPNPYRGLQPFFEADEANFHGRDGAVAELLEMVHTHRFVAVVGPSGCGKSSLVRAGLVPRLRQLGMLVASCIPDDDPFDAVSAALSTLGHRGQTTNIAPAALTEPEGLADAFASLADDEQLALVIDQFEELWTITDERTRRSFLDSLVAAIQRVDVRVIVTVRADFWDRPLADPTIGRMSTRRVCSCAADRSGVVRSDHGPSNCGRRQAW